MRRIDEKKEGKGRKGRKTKSQKKKNQWKIDIVKKNRESERENTRMYTERP